ncbi:MAG: hypothetical protein WBG86_07830, partial [Polyangiales bacterium]
MNARVPLKSHTLHMAAWVCLSLGLGCGSGATTLDSQIRPGLEGTGDELDPQIAKPGEAPDLLARETMAYERARPVFEQYCA